MSRQHVTDKQHQALWSPTQPLSQNLKVCGLRQPSDRKALQTAGGRVPTLPNQASGISQLPPCFLLQGLHLPGPGESPEPGFGKSESSRGLSPSWLAIEEAD